MKKILLITYYFPPCGGAGVQRWLRLIPYLIENGWMPTIITTSGGDYPLYDESLCRKIPQEVKVIRTKTPSLSKLFNKLTGNSNGLPHGSLEINKKASFMARFSYWVRINLIVPDVRKIWNRYAYQSAVKELRSNKYSLIITTGPPHSSHLIGMRLKKRFPIKWLTDFRDPWTEINYLQVVKQNCLIKHINRCFEREVLKKADLNLIVSKTIAKSLPEGNKKVLYNGFDPQDFSSVKQQPRTDNLLRIKYIGVIRKGHPIEEAMNRLNELAAQKLVEKIELSFVGSFNDNSAPSSESLTIRNIAHSTHSNAVQEMIDADILLLLIRKCPDNKGILTTKLFEYIASGSYIIGIGPVDGEAADILRTSNTGIMIDYNDKDGFIKAVTDYYLNLQTKDMSLNERNDINAYSAPQQAKELTLLFNELIVK